MNDPPIYNIGNPSKKRAPNPIFFFIWATKHCPLSFTERLVWSLLVKADRTKGQGTTQADIAARSGLSRVTVREAVKEDSLLRKKSLVIRENHRSWRAVEPKGETAAWFATRKSKSNHWANQLAYWPVELPATPSNPLFDRTLLGLLTTLKGHKPAAYQECYESLAVALGCDYRRVKTVLTKLQKGEVVEVVNTMKNRYGRVVRFDVLLSGSDQATQPAAPVPHSEQPQSHKPVPRPTIQPAVEPINQASKPKSLPTAPAPQRPGEPVSEPLQTAKFIHEPPIPERMIQGSPDGESTEALSIEHHIAGIRRLEDEMRAYMRDVKGYEDWQIGQILGVLCKIPMEDRRRVFFAIINKHGDSSAAVLTEVRNYVQRKKQRERSDAQTFFELEAMSQFVTV